MAAPLHDDLQRQWKFFLGVFSLLYWLGSWGLAVWTPFWFDEFYTLYLSRLPRVQDVWLSLASTDLHPPLNYLLTRASISLLGEGHVSARLPAMIGFWVMSLAIFWFVSRRCGAIYGAIAMMIPSLTKAFGYAQEARPYGIALGCCAVALVCWQSAADGRGRKRSLVGLSLSIAAAASSNYWAVLIVVPLSAGELWRFIRRRTPDWPLWIAVTLGACAVLLYLPSLKAARGIIVPIIARPTLYSVPETYVFLLENTFWPLLAILALLTVVPASEADAETHGNELAPGQLKGYETVAAAALAALPLVAVALAKLAGAGFRPRYAVYWIIGFSILAAMVVRASTGRRRTLPGLLFLSVLGVFMLRSVLFGLMPANGAPIPFRTLLVPVPQSEQGLPVVASTPDLFLQLAYYGEHQLAARLFYLSDIAIATRRLKTNIWEPGLQNLSHLVPLHVVHYRSFLATHERFLVYGPYEGVWDWVAPQLMEDGARVELRGRNGQDFLFLVTAPRAETPNPPGGR